MINMFVSYCHKDSSYVDSIDSYFTDKDVHVHRDVRDISEWKSIREYMKTIRDMNYAVLVITDNYLKSFNCMFEVLEFMKEKDFQDRIFPVVVGSSIYNTYGRIEYIDYWQAEFNRLKLKIAQIENIVNASSVIDDLRRIQNIASNIDEFLSIVSDMNNPKLTDINLAIENNLNAHALLQGNKGVKPYEDTFQQLNIPKKHTIIDPTDMDKNAFMSQSFLSINQVLEKLSNQLTLENRRFQVIIERLDAQSLIYTVYRDGNQQRSIKIFLGNFLGGKDKIIGLSDQTHSFGNSGSTSFNEMFRCVYEDSELLLNPMLFSYIGHKNCTAEEAAKAIWVYYIQAYL